MRKETTIVVIGSLRVKVTDCKVQRQFLFRLQVQHKGWKPWFNIIIYEYTLRKHAYSNILKNLQ